MIRRPPRSTRTDTLFPYTTLFRSLVRRCQAFSAGRPALWPRDITDPAIPRRIWPIAASGEDRPASRAAAHRIWPWRAELAVGRGGRQSVLRARGVSSRTARDRLEQTKQGADPVDVPARLRAEPEPIGRSSAEWLAGWRRAARCRCNRSKIVWTRAGRHDGYAAHSTICGHRGVGQIGCWRWKIRGVIITLPG